MPDNKMGGCNVAWWADLLAAFARKREVSMRQLGEQGGMAGSTVSRVMGGKIRPQRGTVEALSKILDRPSLEIWGWLGLHDNPSPEDGLVIYQQMVTIRGGAVGYISYALWRARTHYPLDKLRDMVGSGILENDPALLYEELDLRLSNYTTDELSSLVRHAMEIIRMVNLLDRRVNAEVRQAFDAEISRMDAMFETSILEVARHMQLKTSVDDIKRDIGFIEQMARGVEEQLDRLPAKLWRPLQDSEER